MASSDRQELERVLSCFDEDGDGNISADELRKCLKRIGEDLSEEEAEVLFEGNAETLVSFDELLRLVEMEQQEEEDEEELMRQAFAVFEMEGSGSITPVSLRRTLNGLGTSPSSSSSWTIDDCTLMIRRFDVNGDGVLSFDEFTNMLL